MARDLATATVVITGASSGIGQASALAFADCGSRLVLAARGEEALAEVAADCERRGCEALAVATDVRDEAAVEELARRAVERFGRIDVWVNSAGVMIYGPFEAVPSEDFRAVIETNLLGSVHGARAALARFRDQGSGILINLSSVWGRVTSPYVSAYVTSKFAVRAFGETLRQELRDVDGIDVATMLPEAVDTPIFTHVGNYAGRGVRPVPPVAHPEDVAQGIVACARSPKREVTFGRAGRALELLHSFAPGVYERLLPDIFARATFPATPAEHTPGNVHAPAPPFAEVRGGWHEDRRVLLRALLGAARGGLRAVRRMLRR